MKLYTLLQLFEEKLQDWEDRHLVAVAVLAAIIAIMMLVFIWGAVQPNGWFLIGQSLKETFWPW